MSNMRFRFLSYREYTNLDIETPQNTEEKNMLKNAFSLYFNHSKISKLLAEFNISECSFLPDVPRKDYCVVNCKSLIYQGFNCDLA